MIRSVRVAVAALAVFLVPAQVGARQQPTIPVPAPAAAHLTIITEYTDGAIVEVVDPSTGARKVVENSRGVAQEGFEDAQAHVEEIGSQAAHCSNSGTYQYIRWGGTSRSRRPWRAPETFRFNTSGAPVAFDWRGEIMAGSDVWMNGTNACGLGDRVGWITPAVGPATATANPCGTSPNNENTIAWRDLGSSGVLARACMWSAGSYIFESEMEYNRNSAIKWCLGSCSGGYDLRSVASHEWGHVIGLGHTCSGGADTDLPSCPTAAATPTVMYPFISAGSLNNRTLSRGDVDGGQNLYPYEYGAEIVAVSLDNPAAPLPLTPGRTYDAVVDVRNTGLAPWAIGGPVELRTPGGPSAYADATWITPSRASSADADLTNATDSRFANDSTVVVRDEVARFAFSFTVPFSKEPNSGTLFDTQSLALTGPKPFEQPAGVAYPLSVGSLRAELVSQSGPRFLIQDGLVVPGPIESTATATVRNAGTAPWFPGEAVLVTDPLGRCSSFAGVLWVSCSEVGALGDNSFIAPGEEVVHQFGFRSPLDPSLSGPHNESLTVVHPGRPAPVTLAGGPIVYSFVVL